MKWAAVVLGLVLNGAIVLQRPPPRLVWIHPVAPPLTHIPNLGEKPLGPRTGAPQRGAGLRWALEKTLHASANDTQRQAYEDLRRLSVAIHPLSARSTGLRIAVQDDAEAAALVLGEARLAAFVAARDSLSVSMGEARVWQDALDAVRR